MKIEKILETVFIKDYNAIALILESNVVIMLWNNKFMDRKECIKYIKEYLPGLIEESRVFRRCKRRGEECGIKYDPLFYEEIYDKLIAYAKKKFKNDFKYNH